MWDPGGVREDKDPNRKQDGMINDHVLKLFHNSQICALGESSVVDGSRTELDSHANMPVVGKHVCIIADTGRVAEVSPCTPDCKAMDVKIVDAAVLHTCPHTSDKSTIVMRNALHVP